MPYLGEYLGERTRGGGRIRRYVTGHIAHQDQRRVGQARLGMVSAPAGGRAVVVRPLDRSLVRASLSEYEVFEDDGLGKSLLQKVVKAVSKTAKAVVTAPMKVVAKVVSAPVSLVSKKAGVSMAKGIVSASKVYRGAVGFKKGLTAGELKGAATLRKVVVGAGAAAGALVLGPVALAGAGKFLGMGTAALPKLTKSIEFFKLIRKTAGLPPVTAETAAKLMGEQAKEQGVPAEQLASGDIPQSVLTSAASEAAKMYPAGSPATAAQATAAERELVATESVAEEAAKVSASPEEQEALAKASFAGGGFDPKWILAALIAVPVIAIATGTGGGKKR